MTGLKAQLNRKLHECGRDPLSLFLLGCVIAAALITFMVLSFLLGYILWQGLPNIETGCLLCSIIQKMFLCFLLWLIQC